MYDPSIFTVASLRVCRRVHVHDPEAFRNSSPKVYLRRVAIFAYVNYRYHEHIYRWISLQIKSNILVLYSIIKHHHHHEPSLCVLPTHPIGCSPGPEVELVGKTP